MPPVSCVQTCSSTSSPVQVKLAFVRHTLTPQHPLDANVATLSLSRGRGDIIAVFAKGSDDDECVSPRRCRNHRRAHAEELIDRRAEFVVIISRHRQRQADESAAGHVLPLGQQVQMQQLLDVGDARGMGGVAGPDILGPGDRAIMEMQPHDRSHALGLQRQLVLLRQAVDALAERVAVGGQLVRGLVGVDLRQAGEARGHGEARCC